MIKLSASFLTIIIMLPPFFISVVGVNVSPSCNVRYLGVMFDESLSFDKHVTDACKSSFAFFALTLSHTSIFIDVN